MRKGNTKVALYGLGNIRDERLYNTFAQGKGQFFFSMISTSLTSTLLFNFCYQQQETITLTGHVTQ
jgi:hypothetical protein